MDTPTCYGKAVPEDFNPCHTCQLVAACWTAFDSGRPDWHGEIPVDGEPLPAAESAYAWLIASGVPDAEAWRRVWGEVPDTYVRPLVAQIRWRKTFSGDGAGRDGSPDWYEFNGGGERQPAQATIDYVMSLR